MAKVLEGIIVGIGFVGGGAILKQDNAVHGTATAASIWATGAIGMSVGLGRFDVAVTISVFTFLTLKLLPFVKQEISLKADEGPDTAASQRDGPKDKRLESNRNKRKKSQPAGD